MKILVTGGLGYIGSHTVVELQKEGFEVVIVDDLSNSSIKVLDGIESITGIRPIHFVFDCNNWVLGSVFGCHPNIKGIIHFAANKSVSESIDNPLKYYKNNINSLLGLFEYSKNIPLIFSSSCTVYGNTLCKEVTEETELRDALSPYGFTKQMCEQIITDTSKATGLKAIILRYFNPIGAHPSGLIGESPKTPSNLVPILTQVASGKRDELLVYGSDYDTPDGTCIRDYVDVVDVAKAHVKALKRLLNNENTDKVEVFNLGTGEGTSVKELINTFESVSGISIDYKVVERREGDAPEIYANVSKAKEVLGWQAETSLEDSLLSAWNWELNGR